MNKSFYQGSATIAVALMLTCLTPSADSRIAQDNSSQNQTRLRNVSGTDCAVIDAPKAAKPASSQNFVATAYSLRGRTASGRKTTRGLIAADRKVLPLGTRVRLEAGSYSGEYLVADSGSAVRGRKIDIWMPHTREAINFGRRKVKLVVLQYSNKKFRAGSSAVARQR